MNQIHQTAQQGFSHAAKLYQHARPNYPEAVVNWLKQDLALDAQSSVIDLGAGTGKFLPYLKQVTSAIYAVEPIREMLQQLQAAHPDVIAIQAHSTAIPLASESIDAIVCAQSFHWFADIESLNEMHQLLRPEGHLGLIWNQRDEHVPWVKAIADILAPLEGDTPRYHSGEWKKVFEYQQLFQLERAHVFPHSHCGSVEQVVSQRLLSTSFIAAMPEAEQLALKAEFEAVIFAFTGKRPSDQITFPYVTYVYDFKKI